MELFYGRQEDDMMNWVPKSEGLLKTPPVDYEATLIAFQIIDNKAFLSIENLTVKNEMSIDIQFKEMDKSIIKDEIRKNIK